MSLKLLNWQKNIWSLIDNYFETNKNYISRNQLDSYNIFLKNQIPKTIRQFNPMIYTKGEHQYLDRSGKQKKHFMHKIEIIIGGSKNEDGTINNDGKGIYLSKPVIQEISKETIHIETDSSTTDQTTEQISEIDGDMSQIKQDIKKNVIVKQLYPNEARLKNLTYSTSISCDIFITITNVIIQTNEYGIGTPIINKGIVQEYSKIPLGNIPIMVKSNLCVLANLPETILHQTGECIYDQGGYFIINGKEKVIISQERQVENRIYIQKIKTDPNIQYELSIRSVPENIFQPARITKLYLTNTNAIYVKIPHCNALGLQTPKPKNIDIPLFLLFRALGNISDKSIILSIIDNNKSELSNEIMNILRNSINELYERKPCFTQHDALNELSKYINVWNKNVIPPDNIKLVMLQDILRNYLIPHVGKSFKEKSVFLSYMVKELLLVKLNIKTETDKDNFMNKRVDTSGYLMGTIFRDLYFRIKNNLRDNLNRAYAGVSETLKEADMYWSVPLGDGRTQLDNLIGASDSMTCVIKINELIQRNILDEGFLYAFKNCWGLKNARGCKQGIVQDLNRLSFLGFSSHLRRLNTNIPSGAKIRAPHSLNSSTYGIICPCETPDGGNIGLRKNLAIMSQITFGTNSDSLKILLHNLHMIDIYDIDTKHQNLYIKVFLNEKLIGYHEYPKYLCDMLRLYKRNALINIYTSISWYVMDNIIKIATTSGRCCRPLLVVNNNQCLLTDKHIEDIKLNKINWKHLIGGFRTLDLISSDVNEPYIEDNNQLIDFNMSDYNKTKAKDKSLQECLKLFEGVIEYVDTEESNNSLIALTPHDLENNHLSTYTYCEIHPTMLFGIIANNIPLLERNQAPRNQFATVHGKQALGVYATNFKNRMDTKVQVMFYPQKPLIQSVYSKYLFTDKIPHGINSIVAVACYSGYNQEDSLIFNKSSIERGLFRTVKFRTYSDKEEINSSSKDREEIGFPDERYTSNMKLGNYSKLDKKTGIIPENTHVTDSDIIVGKVQATGEKDLNGNKLYLDKSLIVKRHESGIIDKVHYNTGNDEQNYIKLRLRKDKIPEIGDKFCSRFGQKGTIGMVLPAEDMPFTKNGVVPDIIMNPHALPSRMTLGQILEVIIGKASVESGRISKLASFSDINENVIGDMLEELGYERYANEVLYNGIDGKQLKVNIFMGPTYYQRLIHQVADKMNSRTSGPQTSLAHQPVGGRSIGGGLRIGEMERDSLLAHGMSCFLKESFMERSDKYSFYISNKSGLLAIVNKEKKIFEDFSKDETKIKVNSEGNIEKFSNKVSDADFICIEAPYTFKLFLQEIESMGVALRLVSSDICTEWELATQGKIKVKKINMKKLEDEQSTQNVSKIITKDNTKTISKQYYQGEVSHLIKPLNKYHNKIKSILLDNKTNNTCSLTHTNKSLLDTSIGRGGDIWKWCESNYTNILGFDIDKIGIENRGEYKGGHGAKKRLEQVKITGTQEQKKWARNSKIYFGVADTSNDIRVLENINEDYREDIREAYRYFPENSFDVVSCQFSIHYYFKEESKIKQYLLNVQKNIKKNGYFLTTCLDGESVYSLLKSNYDKTGSTLCQGILLDPPPIKKTVWGINGNNLDMTRDTLSKDTFDEKINVYYQSIGREMEEYLVHKEHLIRLAASYNLFLISDTETQTNFNILEHSTGLFKDIYNPIKQKYKNLKHLNYYKNKNLKQYSDLHRYYIFKYIPDISEEEKGLLLNSSLEIVNNVDTVHANTYAIKYSYLPNHLVDTFIQPEKLKHKIEDQNNCSIIIYKDKETKVRSLQLEEQSIIKAGTIIGTGSRNESSILNTKQLALNLEKQEKYDESITVYNSLIELLEGEYGKGNRDVQDMMTNKYKIMIKLKDYKRSKEIIDDILEILSQIDLSALDPIVSLEYKQLKSMHRSQLAYCYYKLDNIQEFSKIYKQLFGIMYTIFNRTENGLYDLQIKYNELLLLNSSTYVQGYNGLVDIINNIFRFYEGEEHKQNKAILLEKVFNILYNENKDSLELQDVVYNKMAIICDKNDMTDVCLKISSFRQDNIIDKDVDHTFGVIIPYYDEDLNIHSTQLGGSDSKTDKDDSSKETSSIETSTIQIKPDSDIQKLIINLEKLYKEQLELGVCTIYLVKQTKKELSINTDLFNKECFYEINEDNTTGFLKYNKGALINIGYKLAKNDNKKYIIIMNPDLLYNRSFNNILKNHPNNPECIGRKKTTSNISNYIMDIVKIKMHDYETFNGCPNDIWGPNTLDEIFYNRMRRNTLLKITTFTNDKIDSFLKLNSNKDYKHSKDYRENKDYLYLDKCSQKFSGINQLHTSDILYNIEINKNIKIIDTDFTLETNPFETYEINDETGEVHNILYTIINSVDFSLSYLDIIKHIFIKLIELNIGIKQPTIDNNSIKISIDKHLHNNLFKSLYFENRLNYLKEQTNRILSLLQDYLLHKNIQTFAFDTYDNIFNINYTYHPILGFYIYMYEYFDYVPEPKHILDYIYEQRNKINMYKQQYNKEINATIQDKITQIGKEKNITLLDIIQNNIVYMDDVNKILRLFTINDLESMDITEVIIDTEGMLLEEKQEKEAVFNLNITTKKSTPEKMAYYKIFNSVFYNIREHIQTEYINKLNIPVFSEDMPKEYFDKEINYNGLDHGYKKSNLDFNREEYILFKKSYRLGIVYNSAPTFVISDKETNKTEDIQSSASIIESINIKDNQTYCEDNIESKQLRNDIKLLYESLLSNSIYSLEVTQDTEQSKIDKEVIKDEQSTQEGGNYNIDKAFFSIDNMDILQKGGNKNNIYNVKRKIIYLLKGLPVKYIKQFQFDVEGLYSVTKYTYANRITKLLLKLKGINHTSSILECMSCVGGNSISFMQNFKKCLFVEKDPYKVDMLTNNIANLSKHISKKLADFTILTGNILNLVKNKDNNRLQQGVDIAFVDPPWGGVHYKHSKKIKIKIDKTPMFKFIHSLNGIAKYVVLKLPFNYEMDYLKKNLNESAQIIDIHDIKNTKDKIKMKIIIIELKKEDSKQSNNILNTIKNLDNMELEIDIDLSSNVDTDIHSNDSIFNLEGNKVNTKEISIPEESYKHIVIKNNSNHHEEFEKQSYNEDNEDNENNEIDNSLECEDNFNPIQEDIKIINTNTDTTPLKTDQVVRIIKLN